MFKFGFSEDSKNKEKDDRQEKSLNWIDASKIEISYFNCDRIYEPNEYFESQALVGIKFKLIRSDKVLCDLIDSNSVNIIEAESQHSDLIPAKYEGGLKVWECTYDLGEYIISEDLNLKDKLVLDLGCGAGVIGLLALEKGSVVHFQDYNTEVITSVTIPNVFLNFKERLSIREKCDFYSGDWSSFTTLLSKDREKESKKYDYIFTSETIYNPDNHRKLYEVFKNWLKPDGIGYVAAKTYYFGVGGGTRQFEKVVKEDGTFDVKVVWKNPKGLQREILKLSRSEMMNVA